ncbi:hypothetical protein PVL29_015330 [Vitis rotundifolia]|uniref:AB hydrolase-1 domain-containing protein n=1 Tax=Vitis rotundifolia TaxID=103349 RepID=A0AA38ZC96_VITRO|nr:hypothetical protein PVL29_015330 [Vitis rotundifolia]
MEQIEHKYVEVNRLKLHVAVLGTGPKVVLFLHGLPETWYSWRHQMVAAAAAGYRSVAFDFRGYGLSQQPPEPEKASFDDLVVDIIGVMDSLGISKAFLVGKDFGALPAFQVAVVHPERVSGVITLGVPFTPPGACAIQMQLLPKASIFREPGRAEADFGRFDVKTVIRNIYILFCRSELQVASDDQEIMDLVDPSTPLPVWFTEEDLKVYSSLYENSGFHTDCAVKDPKITAPGPLIVGEKDYVLKSPRKEEYIKSKKVKEFMPNLEIMDLRIG